MKKTWGLIIDVARCHDCNNCFLACKDEFVGNNWLPYSKSQPDTGHRWMNIHRREQGEYPLVEVAYLPQPCQHCKNPPCLKADRNGAVSIREDGIVLIDPDKAAGQKQLVNACPYGAVFWNETHQTAQKCTMCAHLLDEGWEEPRCAQVCPTGAITAHNLDEEKWQSLIYENDLTTNLPEHGTGSRVLYKNIKKFTHGFIAGSVALKDTDEVAQNARILLTDDRGQRIMETITDNYGDFKLRGIKEATDRFQVEIKVADLPVKSLVIDFKASLNLGTIFI
jgi:Fe-S-cluster-containing dehydrogenase component